MKVEFQWETFYEDDNVWNCLFVRFDNTRWFCASQHFGTENEEEILQILKKRGFHPKDKDYPYVFFDFGRFHESFINSYKGMSIPECRRKLKNYYSKSDQNAIISFLKHNNYIK